jgi:hypothetical protein
MVRASFSNHASVVANTLQDHHTQRVVLHLHRDWDISQMLRSFARASKLHRLGYVHGCPNSYAAKGTGRQEEDGPDGVASECDGGWMNGLDVNKVYGREKGHDMDTKQGDLTPIRRLFSLPPCFLPRSSSNADFFGLYVFRFHAASLSCSFYSLPLCCLPRARTLARPRSPRLNTACRWRVESGCPSPPPSLEARWRAPCRATRRRATRPCGRRTSTWPGRPS